MKVGEFRRITCVYGDGITWYVTRDGNNFIELRDASVQNMPVSHLVFLEKDKAIVLWVNEPIRAFKSSVAENIAWKLNVNAGELKQACREAGVDLDAIQRIRDEKLKTAETRKNIKKHLSEMAKSGSLFTTLQMQQQMEMFVSDFQQQG